MKRLLLGILAVAMLVLSGCGDSSVTVVVPLQPPSITTLSFTQDRIDEFIDGSVDFFAPSSDIDTITVEVFDSRGVLVISTTTARNLFELERGTIFFSIFYGDRTFLVDTLTLSVYLTDFNGFRSARVEGSFPVP